MNTSLQLALDKVANALTALHETVQAPMQANRFNVDACIQRFEFSIELFWKLLKKIIEEKGVEVTFPKDILREAYKGNLIDHENIWLQMLHDRNLTSHTYNKELADKIYHNIKTYYPILQSTFDMLHGKLLNNQL